MTVHSLREKDVESEFFSQQNKKTFSLEDSKQGEYKDTLQIYKRGGGKAIL